MARYKVYYINRSGHVTTQTIFSSCRHAALKAARRKFDDVIKVKRLPGLALRFAVIAAIVAAVVLIFAFA